jgi:hypothetical protein
MLTYAVLLSAFSQLAIVQVNQRETGQLKLMAVVLILIARVGYGVRLSVNGLADVVLFAVLGTAAIAGVAMAATVLVTDVDSAGAVLP